LKIFEALQFAIEVAGAVVVDPGAGEISVPGPGGGGFSGNIDYPITMSDSCKTAVIFGGAKKGCGGECLLSLGFNLWIFGAKESVPGVCEMRDTTYYGGHNSPSIHFPTCTCGNKTPCVPKPPEHGQDEWGRKTVTFYGCYCGEHKITTRETYADLYAGDSRSWLYCEGRQNVRVKLESFEYEDKGQCYLKHYTEENISQGIMPLAENCFQNYEDLAKVQCDELMQKDERFYINNSLKSSSRTRTFYDCKKCTVGAGAVDSWSEKCWLDKDTVSSYY
jgi:hypothetical protein